jgi:hypothetical protein
MELVIMCGGKDVCVCIAVAVAVAVPCRASKSDTRRPRIHS